MRFVSAPMSYGYNFPTKRLADQTASCPFAIIVPATGQTISVDFGVPM